MHYHLAWMIFIYFLPLFVCDLALPFVFFFLLFTCEFFSFCFSLEKKNKTVKRKNNTSDNIFFFSLVTSERNQQLKKQLLMLKMALCIECLQLLRQE
jgi:hypothetical protein